MRAHRQLELLPYTSGRMEFVHVDSGNPFRDGSDPFGAAGVDLKYGVTSDLTLNATVDPDFGQVEVDPAVVNLTAFETFFDEKRPFFVEGADKFRFGSMRTYNPSASSDCSTRGAWGAHPSWAWAGPATRSSRPRRRPRSRARRSSPNTRAAAGPWPRWTRSRRASSPTTSTPRPPASKPRSNHSPTISSQGCGATSAKAPPRSAASSPRSTATCAIRRSRACCGSGRSSAVSTSITRG